MNENAKYKIGGSFHTRAELIRQAGEQVQNMPSETAKEYLSCINTFLELDMEQEKQKSKEDKFRTRIVPTIGLLLVILMLGWAYYFPFPSGFQSGVFWVTFCLFIAIASYFVMGYFHIEHKVGEVFVKAGGSLGIFALMYLCPPNAMKGVHINRKVDVIIMLDDTTTVHKISADFNPLEQSEIATFVKKTIIDYYGSSALDTFTCFRRSDGKIINFERCSTLGNESLLAISVEVLRQFKTPHDAYEYLLKRIR